MNYATDWHEAYCSLKFETPSGEIPEIATRLQLLKYILPILLVVALLNMGAYFDTVCPLLQVAVSILRICQRSLAH